jgi:hypothetical protein
LRDDDEPPRSRLPLLVLLLRFDELPVSRVDALFRVEEPSVLRLELLKSRVPALVDPALRDPAESRVPT